MIPSMSIATRCVLHARARQAGKSNEAAADRVAASWDEASRYARVARETIARLSIQGSPSCVDARRKLDAN